MTMSIHQASAEAVKKAQEVLTSDRIREIIKGAGGPNRVSCANVTEQEDCLIRDVWLTLPSTACWNSAWICVVHNRDANGQHLERIKETA